jgi:hypothetical protein
MRLVLRLELQLPDDQLVIVESFVDWHCRRRSISLLTVDACVHGVIQLIRMHIIGCFAGSEVFL